VRRASSVSGSQTCLLSDNVPTGVRTMHESSSGRTFRDLLCGFNAMQTQHKKIKVVIGMRDKEVLEIWVTVDWSLMCIIESRLTFR
jgi:hypothetical protein